MIFGLLFNKVISILKKNEMLLHTIAMNQTNRNPQIDSHLCKTKNKWASQELQRCQDNIHI